jgi:hypothetical protein
MSTRVCLRGGLGVTVFAGSPRKLGLSTLS